MKILNRYNQTVIYEDDAELISETIQNAVEKGVSLTSADLKSADLVYADMRSANLRSAREW